MFGDCDATCAVSCAGGVDCWAKIHVSLIKTASDIAHRYSLIRYECYYGLQTMKENLMHIENWADVLCIQMIDTVNNLQPSYHADIVFRPFVPSGVCQLRRISVKDSPSLTRGPVIPQAGGPFLIQTASLRGDDLRYRLLKSIPSYNRIRGCQQYMLRR